MSGKGKCNMEMHISSTKCCFLSQMVAVIQLPIPDRTRSAFHYSHILLLLCPSSTCRCLEMNVEVAAHGCKFSLALWPNRVSVSFSCLPLDFVPKTF